MAYKPILNFDTNSPAQRAAPRTPGGSSLAVADANNTTREKIALQQSKDKRLDTLIDALSKVSTNKTNAELKFAALTEKAKSDFMKAANDYLAKRDSGSAAEAMRARIELAKVMINSPINFAKAAYAPNEGLLTRVSAALGMGPTAPTGLERDKMAWSVYLKGVIQGAGNQFGTYRAMQKMYPTGEKQIAGDEGTFEWSQLAYVKGQVEVEGIGAEHFDDVMREFTEPVAAFDKYVKDTGKDPNDKKTMADFTAYYHPVNQPAVPTLPAFEKNIEAMATNPDAFADDNFTKQAQSGVQEAKDMEDFLKLQIAAGGDEKTKSEDTDRDRMANWISQPGVQEWAASRGFKLGTVLPMTKDLQDKIDAGTAPPGEPTKYGFMIPNPDDWRAWHAARRDLMSQPEERVFRAAGWGRQNSKPVEVTLREGAKVVEMYHYGGEGKPGDVAKLDDGTWASTMDGGVSWQPLTAGAAQALVDAGAVKADSVDTTVRPFETTRTVLGESRRMIYRDAPGSRRWAEKDVHGEQYAPPEDIVSYRELGRRTETPAKTPADVLRNMSVKGMERRTGITQDEPVGKEYVAGPVSYDRTLPKLKGGPEGPLVEQEAAKEAWRKTLAAQQNRAQQSTPANQKTRSTQDVGEADIMPADMSKQVAPKPSQVLAEREQQANEGLPSERDAAMQKGAATAEALNQRATGTTAPTPTTPSASVDPIQKAYRDAALKRNAAMKGQAAANLAKTPFEATP